jgi:hypothetical protein
MIESGAHCLSWWLFWLAAEILDDGCRYPSPPARRRLAEHFRDGLAWQA